MKTFLALLAVVALATGSGAWGQGEYTYIVDTYQCPNKGPRLIRLTYYDDHSRAYRITIVDSGNGLPEEQAAKVWPLLQTKKPLQVPAFSLLALPDWSSPWGWLVWGKSQWGAGCGP